MRQRLHLSGFLLAIELMALGHQTSSAHLSRALRLAGSGISSDRSGSVEREDGDALEAAVDDTHTQCCLWSYSPLAVGQRVSFESLQTVARWGSLPFSQQTAGFSSTRVLRFAPKASPPLI